MRPTAGKFGVCVWLCCIVAVGSAKGAPVGMPEAPPADAPADVRAAIADLYSDDGGTRERAMGALKEIGPRAAPAVPYLTPLCSSYGMNSEVARDALMAIGKAAVPALVQALTDPETHIWGAIYASQALAGMSDQEGRQALREVMLDDALPRRPRSKAMEALAGVKDEPSIPALAQLLKTSELRLGLAYVASLSLARFGQPGVDAMVGVLVADDVVQGNRERAAEGIAKAEGCDVVAPLGGVLTDANSPSARLAAVAALKKLQDERIEALLVAALIDDADAGVRAAGATALSKFAGRHVTIALLTALRDDRAVEVRRAAADVLCGGYPLRVTADDTPDLVHVLDTDSDWRVLSLVVEALREEGDRRAVEALCRTAIKEWTGNLIGDWIARQGLKRLGDGRCVRWLMATLARVNAMSGSWTTEMMSPAWRASDALVACTGEEPWIATPREESLTRQWRAWLPWWEQNKTILGEEQVFVFTYEVGSEDVPPRTTRNPRRGGGIAGTIDVEVREPIERGEETPADEAAEDDQTKDVVRMQMAILPVAKLDSDEPKIEFEVGEPEFLEPLPELSLAQRGMLNIETGMILDKLKSDVCHIPLSKDDVGDLLGHKRTITKTVPFASLRAVLFMGADMSFTLTRPAFAGGGD